MNQAPRSTRVDHVLCSPCSRRQPSSSSSAARTVAAPARRPSQPAPLRPSCRPRRRRPAAARPATELRRVPTDQASQGAGVPIGSWFGDPTPLSWWPGRRVRVRHRRAGAGAHRQDQHDRQAAGDSGPHRPIVGRAVHGYNAPSHRARIGTWRRRRRGLEHPVSQTVASARFDADAMVRFRRNAPSQGRDAGAARAASSAG